MTKKTPKIRLFIHQPLTQDGTILLDDKQSHYVVNVMRHGQGDMLLVFNGSDGEFEVSIVKAHKKKTELLVGVQTRKQTSTPDCILFLAPLKKQAMDFAIQKATECGATKIVPVVTEYTQSSKVNIERFERIAVEASEQCERLDVPVIMGVQKISDVWKLMGDTSILYLAAEDGRGESIDQIVETDKTPALLIGPEGGFSPSEFEFFEKQDVVRFLDLGNRILKAETAVIAGLTLINHGYQS